jgi:prevent-host-death family protein
MSAALALKPLETLPHTPASDVKKLGWRGVMKAVARNGRVVVTNHNQPEAVILPVEDYNHLLQLLREAATRDEAALDALRRKYDERLACLNEPGAGDKLAALLDKPLDLGGRVIAGEGH